MSRTALGEYLGPAALAKYESSQPENNYNDMFGNILTNVYYTCYSRAIAR